MTRKEAVQKFAECGITNPLASVKALEAIGLIKFDENTKSNKVDTIFKLYEGDDGHSSWGRQMMADSSMCLNDVVNKYGTIRLEAWPEGLVLWVGGEIRWRSWK
jgi:hypothetical protein